jgi:hypothetical protein
MVRLNNKAEVVAILEILGASLKQLLSTLQQSSFCERNALLDGKDYELSSYCCNSRVSDSLTKWMLSKL